MRNTGLFAALMLFTACSSSGSETGTGGSGGGASGSAGNTGVAGASAGNGGAGRGGATAGSAGSSGSTGASGSAGTAGTAGGATAGTGGASAGNGGATAGAGGVTGGASGATGGAGGATAGSGGTAGANGGRGGATAGAGGGGGTTAGAGGAGTGGSAGAGGSAGTGGRGGNGGTSGAAGRGGAGGTSVTDGGVDGGGDGGVAFNPCPAAGTACIIMPLGDSITDGVGSSGGGYRVPLFQQTITSAKLITFVGRQINGPTTVGGRAFPQHHEGYSGYTIDPGGGRDGISPLVDGAISMFHPHIVLLMIGTNDVNISLDLANAATRLGALIDRITTDAPNALLVIARITPTKTPATNARIQTYNNAIPGLVQTRVAAGKHIAIVDMYAAFTANTNYMTALMNDELHPNDAGYMVMAQSWYAALSSILRSN